MTNDRKRIIILGCTGSIGVGALDIASHQREMVQVVGLGAGQNIDVLRRQVQLFHPCAISVQNESDAIGLRMEFPQIAVYSGPNGAADLVNSLDADIVLAATSGLAGLPGVFAAAQRGVRIALANKEALVAAGTMLLSSVAKSGGEIIPVDSEHSAIWQALRGWRLEEVSRLILTASGGPFFGKTRECLAAETVDTALRHPTWKMGRKITIDSSTLMNKGLEIIEAHHLFGVPYDKIDVLVHPESIVHSIVEFVDGSQLAQCSVPDMRIPIQLAFSYPARWAGKYVNNAWQGTKWTFHAPDRRAFGCLNLAIAAGKAGGSHPVVLNAGNEVAVESFLAGQIPFLGIEDLVERVLSANCHPEPQDIDEILEIDLWARREARAILRQKAVY